MTKYHYSDKEKELNKVAVKQNKDILDLKEQLSNIEKTTENNIADTEQLLQSLGVELPNQNFISTPSVNKKPISMRSWEEIVSEANVANPYDVAITDLFTPEELISNEEHIKMLQDEFNSLHKLDVVDYTIAGIAGAIAGIINLFFVKTPVETDTVTITNVTQKLFNIGLSPERIKDFEEVAKVTFDAPYNKSFTNVYVEGLSTNYHRLLSLGHDPFLGFIFGVVDMLRGTMTTIDNKGSFVIQNIERYSDRMSINLFDAVWTVFKHMLSDINTERGLPVPFMALFNFFQSEKITINKNGITQEVIVAEVVQVMYREGYDFKHFLSMSFPVMLIEIIVRISYFIKRLSEGHTVKESIPIGLDREKKPKLASMLWIAHTVATTPNVLKVLATKNPLFINYPQWLAFAKYSIQQLKWVLMDKPELRNKYVQGFLDEEWDKINLMLEETWQKFNEK